MIFNKLNLLVMILVIYNSNLDAAKQLAMHIRTAESAKFDIENSPNACATFNELGKISMLDNYNQIIDYILSTRVQKSRDVQERLELLKESIKSILKQILINKKWYNYFKTKRILVEVSSRFLSNYYGVSKEMLEELYNQVLCEMNEAIVPGGHNSN